MNKDRDILTSKRPLISAGTLHVDELVERALRGHIRIPPFQRKMKWRAHDVQQLFDSIYRGFPIGTLLMWKRPAGPADISFGPLQRSVDGTEDAWWVVDGQQRLTSLVAALHHPRPSSQSDPFVVYFSLDQPSEGDPSAKQPPPFFRPHRLRPADDLSMPLAQALDATGFQTWLFDFVSRTDRRDLIGRASDLSTRIRNYRVPVYVVETDDPDTAREMFLRVNKAGRRLEAHEVFAALAPSSVASADITPESIANRISSDLGPIEPNAVAKAAQALRGDDVTRIRMEPREGVDHVPWMRQTERAIRRSLDFISECGVAHPRLLPHRLTPVVTLARFFHRFEAPHERNTRLLRRWLWRGFFGDALSSDAKTFRRAVVAVREDEDEAVQSLLAQVPKLAPIVLPTTFDARKGTARLAMLILALQEPVPPPPETRDLFMSDESGELFDWLQEEEASVFTKFPGAPNSPEARFITPGTSPAQLKGALISWAREDRGHPALISHLITPTGADALLADDIDHLMSLRRSALIEAASRVQSAFTEPDHGDRPPLRELDE